MDYTFNGIDFLSFIVLIVLFLYVLFTNEIRQLHKVYIAFHLAMMIWPFGMFSLSMTGDPDYQWYYVNASFVGVSFLGYGWLMFSLMLARGLYRLKKILYLLAGLPALLAAVMITLNPLHGQFVSPVDGLYFERDYGPVFWYLVAISIVYVLLGSMVMISSLRSTHDGTLRKQIALFLIGQCFMLLLALLDTAMSSTSWMSGVGEIRGLTSAGIVISDVCFVIAIRKNNAFRIISIALREVVDSMDTGIVITDDRHAVLDRNAVAGRFCAMKIGKPFPVEALLDGATDQKSGGAFLHSYYHDPWKHLQTEAFVAQPFPSHVSVRIKPIYSESGAFIGRIVTLQDVTEWRRVVRELHDRNQDLLIRNNELTHTQEELSLANRKLELLATTDSLTGCYNRRYLYQMLEYQIAVEQRYRTPFSLMLFDIDHFKKINDTFGHHIGDEVLRHMASLIRGRLRESDIFARHGGEEFTIYLPHTEKKDALKLAEALLHIVESQTVRTDRGDIGITISMGLISVEGNGHQVNGYQGNGYHRTDDPKQFLVDIMRKADEALYQAKHQGRNRIVVA